MCTSAPCVALLSSNGSPTRVAATQVLPTFSAPKSSSFMPKALAVPSRSAISSDLFSTSSIVINRYIQLTFYIYSDFLLYICNTFTPQLKENREHICDQVCKNQFYLHIKFDLNLSLSSLITLFPNTTSTLSNISSYTQNFLRIQ